MKYLAERWMRQIRGLPLRWEIGALLLVKLVALFALYHLYFNQPVVATKTSWLAPVSPPVVLPNQDMASPEVTQPDAAPTDAAFKNEETP